MKHPYNFNAIRPALVAAHNSGNTKAINKDLCEGLEIDVSILNEWSRDCKALQATVYDYVTAKNDKWTAGHEKTEEQLDALRSMIFPKWKEVLHCAEESKEFRDLHIDERDVEDLVGYAYKFMATGMGTVQAPETDNIFRKKIESLIGCKMARNLCLTAEERDTLSEYYGARKSKQSAIEKIAKLEDEIKTFKKLIKPGMDEDYKSFLDAHIAEINKEINKLKERKTAAEDTMNNLVKEASKIEACVKLLAPKTKLPANKDKKNKKEEENAKDAK